jgi:NAD(P)-dependent dehydrogenase (short-subunit alcohol dehydrogenase family)
MNSSQAEPARLPLSEALCVVTGATSGIGLATALALARLGATLTLVGRDGGRIAAALALVAPEAERAGAPPPRGEMADFASMREVAALAGRLATGRRLDLLVNCAGVFLPRRRLGPEGLETQFAVNHLAPFLLTTSLLPLLEAAPSARVLMVSSASHRQGRIRWRDPSMRRFYFGLWAYEQAKLANLLFSYELARRLGPSSPVSVYAFDPGLVDTAVGQKEAAGPSGLFWRLRRRWGTSPELPAAALAELASSAAFAGRTGLYWKEGRALPSSPASRSLADATRLWELSEKLVAEALGGRAWTARGAPRPRTEPARTARGAPPSPEPFSGP